MKLYEIVTINLKNNGEHGDEFQTYLGFDFDEAQVKKAKALADFDNLTEYDKQGTTVECRVYEIDEVDPLDEDAINEAMIDAIGYNLF